MPNKPTKYYLGEGKWGVGFIPDKAIPGKIYFIYFIGDIGQNPVIPGNRRNSPEITKTKTFFKSINLNYRQCWDDSVTFFLYQTDSFECYSGHNVLTVYMKG